MQPSSSAVSATKRRRLGLLILAALLIAGGGIAWAQYANGEEAPLRPEPPAQGSIQQIPSEEEAQVAVAESAGKGQKTDKAAPAENLPTGDNIDAYTAAEIVAQAQAAQAAKDAAATAQADNTGAATSSDAVSENMAATDAQAAPAESGEAAPAEVPTDAEINGDDNVALLPVEKLSPPPEPPVQMQTVVVEQAIYRCPKGNSYIYVDSDKRKGYNRCTLFRAEKTEEVPVGSAPTSAAPPTSGNPNNCSGTLQYKGSTYLFMEHQPCPIPDSIFQRLTPAATSH